MPLKGNSIEIEPHFRVLTIGMNKFAEMLLHLTFKKDDDLKNSENAENLT